MYERFWNFFEVCVTEVAAPAVGICSEVLYSHHQYLFDQLADHGGRSTKTHPKGRPLAPKTLRHIAFLVQGCLNQVVDWDLIPKNPVVNVT